MGEGGDFSFVDLGEQCTSDRALAIRFLWESMQAGLMQLDEVRAGLDLPLIGQPPGRVGDFSKSGPAPLSLPGYC